MLQDPYWNKLLWYCVDNGSYKGCFLPERQEFSEKEFGEEQYPGYEVENHHQPSDAQWGGDWGYEENNYQPSDVQWGGDWGEPANDFKPSDVQWGEAENDFKPLDVQRGDAENSYEPSNVQCGEAENNFKPSDAPWDDL